MKSLKYLSILIFLTISSKSHLQPWCLELPATLEEIVACNEHIAKTFAPNLGQWVGDCFEVAAGSDSDRILKVNYDGDWVGNNNWNNLINLDNPSFNFSF